MTSIAIERILVATEEVRVLVSELEEDLSAEYLPEQRHGLSLDAIFQPHVRFFVARVDGDTVGCGGVALDSDFAEVKRMYVRARARGRGVAHALLAQIETEDEKTPANGGLPADPTCPPTVDLLARRGLAGVASLPVATRGAWAAEALPLTRRPAMRSRNRSLSQHGLSMMRSFQSRSWRAVPTS
jgi:GNAT superfamily N-acetyltransferase